MKIIMLLFLISCLVLKGQQSNCIETNNTVEIEIQQIRNIQNVSRNIPIVFVIKNKIDAPIYINNPVCWGSSMPLIRINRQKVYPIIKVKVNPACKENLVKINGQDSIVLDYNYSLNKLVDLEKSGSYSLQFEYSGSIYSADKEKIKEIDLRTNEVFFEVLK